MPLALQAKLLRVLQEKEYEPLGSNEVLACDVRMIAATSRDLETAVAEERFRADLYYRLNVLPIRIPPLRERLDDLALLAEAILDGLPQVGGQSTPDLTADGLALLQRQPWPGNVRELRNVLERAVLLGDDSQLDAAALAEALGVSAELPAKPVTSATGETYAEARLRFDRELFQTTLAACGGKVDEAARRLGLGRSTLYKKLVALGLMSRI